MENKVSLKLYSNYDNFFDIQDSILSGISDGYDEAFLRFYSRSDNYDLHYYLKDGHIEIDYTIFGAVNYIGEEYWTDDKIKELETKIRLAYIEEYGGDLNYLIRYYFEDEEVNEDYELNDKGFTHSGIATELDLAINIIFDFMDDCSNEYTKQRIDKYTELIKERMKETK